MLELSLVFPCFNEADNLPRLVENIAEAYAGNEAGVEIILVDNGSTDHTQEVLGHLIAPYSYMQTCRVPINRGYGFGILSGLTIAKGEVLGWTHADMQTDPEDALEGLSLFRQSADYEQLFVKGRRCSRPIRDQIFTFGMSAFESLLFGVRMWEINAQPTMFHRRFYSSWSEPPNDFLFDLFVYIAASQSDLTIKRFPVYFRNRTAGVGANDQLFQKVANSRKTLIDSLALRRRLHNDRYGGANR